jgi:RHS repeat-associated protein
VRRTNSRSRRRAPDVFVALVLAAELVVVAPAAVSARTTVYTYSYNVDAALTAITTQVNQNTPATTYLTWDDFTPDATTPTTGTVAAGDGRLVGFGPSPGADNLTARFEFDPRDRLLEYSGDAGDETYDYHANGTMMSSSAGGDDRRFYFDGAKNSLVTNIREDATGLTSAYLGNNRFLSDGTEQILMQPRKDMACTYDAASRTLQSYAYDAFGAPPEEDKPSGVYDLRDNPFRYSGEYRDPIWGGYYLRARWYDPDLPVFLSRDPAQHLNRYAYGAGNPVMSTDPTGHGVGSFLRKLDKTLNAGVGGHFARIFLAPLLGPLQIAAYPKQFWKAVQTDRGGIDIFLALGVVSEVGGGLADLAYAGYARLGVRYLGRFLSDTGIGLGSSVTAGASRGFGHFDWNAFGQGLEYSANPFLVRGFTGFNVRTGFRLSGAKVGDLFEQLRDAPDDTALVFRQRLSTGSSTNSLESSASSTSGILGGNAGFDKPFTQALHLSVYHEKLIAITKDDVFTNEVTSQGVIVSKRRFIGYDFDRVKRGVESTFKGKLEFVGRVDRFDLPARRQFVSNPYNLPEVSNSLRITLQTRGGAPSTYFFLTNNCQHHAYAVLRDMGLR